jgi:hypothetical protein
MNTVPSIDVSMSLNLEAYKATITSQFQEPQYPVNVLLKYIICLVIIKNTECLNMGPKQHPNTAFMQHTD